MRRREFITLLGGAAASWPLAAGAQPAGPLRLIGVLMDYAENDPASQSLVAVFRDELAKLGWKEGGNLRIEVRWSAGNADRVRTFAKELVNLRPTRYSAGARPRPFPWLARRGQFQSSSRPYLIRSAVASSPASRIPAAISAASRMSKGRLAANGSNY